MKSHVLLIRDGRLVVIHDDGLPLKELGRVAIRRASHVEPTDDAGWTADLSLVNGPVLGPFESRRVALDAERDWLVDHLAELLTK